MEAPGTATLNLRLTLVDINPHHAVSHALRLSKKKPHYIDPSRTHLNRVLYAPLPLPDREERVDEWLTALEQEAKEKFKELKKAGVVPKNQGWKAKSPLVDGILTLSREAQEKVGEEGKLEEFLREATEYLKTLADALGTDLLYAVVHLDETAPHVHFALANFRTRDPKMEAVKRLGWEDLWENLKAGKGRALTSTFAYAPPDKQRAYSVPLTRLQDTLNFFNRLGFRRGIPKKERLERGEPKWKVINRKVKRLHEDLPKEIAEKERKLREVEESLRQAEERLKRGRDAIVKLIKEKAKEVGLRKETVGVVRRREVYDAEKVNRLLNMLAREIAEAGNMVAQAKRLEENLSEARRELLEARKERERLEEEAQRLRKEIDRLRKVEAELRKKQKPQEELGQEQNPEQKLGHERRRRWRLRGPGL